jgi:hypothetical protein
MRIEARDGSAKIRSFVDLAVERLRADANFSEPAHAANTTLNVQEPPTLPSLYIANTNQSSVRAAVRLSETFTLTAAPASVRSRSPANALYINRIVKIGANLAALRMGAHRSED